MAEESQSHERQPLLRSDVDATEVYPIIQMIRWVNTPFSYEALSAPDLTYTLIRPLEEKYAALQRRGNLAVVFCLLLNRAYFIRDRNLTTSSLSRSRASLCELLAIKALKEHAHNMLELALALTTSWPVYSGADEYLLERIREERDDGIEERVGNAIEIAIISQAKRFIKSSACQKVIDGIWSGKIVYQADSSRSILSDTYKRNPIHFYDPHKAPLLDHYRLKVPAVRSVLEYSNFSILFILFVTALEFSERARINIPEGIFMIYALGFTLEKVAAMQEHGIKVYFKGTWNGFDLAFVTLYCAYAVMRIYGIAYQRPGISDAGIDVLALIAVLMFPRLAFVTLRNNLMVLSLRAMIMQFVVLMLIAAFCFGGFLYALWTTIAWWMLDLWFGLDASGFENATRFHPVFGPVMMVTYACLSNTLLLTGTFSYILSHTFSTINDDALAEAMFRRAVSTIEGVKADSLFSYQPPVNLFALCVMLPASYILSPRWFHKVNVFMIRLTSFPILLLIAWYERQAKESGAITFYETVSAAAEKVFDTLPRQLKRLSLFDGLMAGSDSDIDAIFEIAEELEQESALDMHDDDGPIPPIDINRPRRQSQASKRHVSFSQSSPRSRDHHHGATDQRPSPSSSPRKAESTTPQRAPLPLPRARINSILSRGMDLMQNTASPLAQVFQPLIMDDYPESADQPQTPTADSPPAPLVSYGPATRRRLSSMHLPVSPTDTTAPRRFPTIGGGPGNTSPRTRSGLGLITSAVSESPDEHRSEGPTPVGMIEEEPGSLISRLERMEDRQKRIENILLNMSLKLSPP
ncbi:hypothetical protein K474DRAFT_1686181 [Panus rudis PR-1116 ss-1]|nr:hypothetical protein K474DRAFT_1686181 [Panus rudis PR-1116 ss-1]